MPPKKDFYPSKLNLTLAVFGKLLMKILTVIKATCFKCVSLYHLLAFLIRFAPLKVSPRSVHVAW